MQNNNVMFVIVPLSEIVIVDNVMCFNKNCTAKINNDQNHYTVHVTETQKANFIIHN